MKTNGSKLLLTLSLAATLFAVVAAPVSAAGDVSETFDSTTLPASLEYSAGPPATFPGGVALFSDGNRGYLRTVDDDYAAVDFTAEVTVTIFDNPTRIAFFGLGVGDPLPWFYDEPQVGPHIYSRTTPDDFGNGFFDVTDNSVTPPFVPFTAGTGTHRLQLVWDASSGTATLSIHRFYTGGPFVASTTLTAEGSDNGFTNADARIFFGGGAGIAFDDFTVVTVIVAPEILIADQIVFVESLGLSGGTENALTSKLDNARASLDAGNETAAVNQIEAFKNQVQAQAGKKIDAADAELMLDVADAVIGLIEVP